MVNPLGSQRRDDHWNSYVDYAFSDFLQKAHEQKRLRLEDIAIDREGVIVPMHDPIVWQAWQKAGTNWLNQLIANKASETQLAADLKLDGQTYKKVGVRARGVSSFSWGKNAGKLPLRITLDAFKPGGNVYGYKTLILNNGHNDPAADGERGAKLDNAIASLTDEIRSANQTIARAAALEGSFMGTFDYAGWDAKVASLEAELQDALEARPGFDWSEAPAPQQHTTWNPSTGTYAICDGPRPARS